VNDLLGILALVVLVLLNGYFVASEFALVSVRRTKIDQLVNENVSSARSVQAILKKLDLYIASTQLGITMASLSIGFVAEPAIEHLIAPALKNAGLEESTVKTISFATAFIISTILHIVFGELAPKTLALQRSEQTSLAVAVPLLIFTTIFRPVIISLNWLGNAVVKLFGLEPDTGHRAAYSSEEIRMIVDSSGQAGVFEQQAQEMLENVFEFQDTPVKAIMVHRTEVEAMEKGSSLREMVALRKKFSYSRLPVFDETVDNIIGIVHTQDALLHVDELDSTTVDDLMRPAFFVPENMKVRDLFSSLKKQKSHMAIVVDEFGGMSGLVTLENVLEELVGDIYDETDEEEEDVERLSENEYLVEADLHIDDVETLLDIELDGRDSGEFETIAGYIFSKLGYIPQIGETVRASGWDFEIVDASERQIKKVRISPFVESSSEGEAFSAA